MIKIILNVITNWYIFITKIKLFIICRRSLYLANKKYKEYTEIPLGGLILESIKYNIKHEYKTAIDELNKLKQE